LVQKDDGVEKFKANNNNPLVWDEMEMVMKRIGDGLMRESVTNQENGTT
jgi:hypothetical protein